MRTAKPSRLESKPFVGTISEIAEMLAESVKSLDDLEKAILRASLTGKLGPSTDLIQ